LELTTTFNIATPENSYVNLLVAKAYNEFSLNDSNNHVHLIALYLLISLLLHMSY